MSIQENIFSQYSELKSLDVTDKAVVEKLYEQLLAMDLATDEGIKEFLEKRDLLERHLTNEEFESYFLMTTDVANKKWKKRHEHIEKEIKPLARIYTEKLNKHFLNSSRVKSLPAPFDVLRRNLSSEIELFHPGNVKLLKEVELIHMEITELQGKLTVQWEGKEVPIPFLYKQFEKTDRNIRKQAFEVLLEADNTLVDTIDEKFNKLLRLRQEIAENAGFKSYTDYRFKELKRFNWGPADCFEFHHAVKKHILPLGKALSERRKKGLGLDILRPYDGGCDPLGREPLKIYEKGNSAELIAGTGKIICAIDSELHGFFKHMRDNGFFDLDVRKNKAQTAYMVSYPVYEQASVFMSGSGRSDDLMTILHELGHCFHYFLSKHVQPYSLQDWTPEVAEVGSITMEYFGIEELGHFLTPEQVERMKESRLRSVVGAFLYMARGDEFQHWIYANPEHSVEERRQKWLDLTATYNTGYDRSGYEESTGKSGWQFPHVLQLPFYLIDYAISEILALTLWDRYKSDPADAIHHYKNGCSLAGSRPVPEIYEIFGSRFSFGEDVIEPLAKRIATDLELEISNSVKT